MRGFRSSNVFHYFSTVHPKPNELFSGSELLNVFYLLVKQSIPLPSTNLFDDRKSFIGSTAGYLCYFCCCSTSAVAAAAGIEIVTVPGCQWVVCTSVSAVISTTDALGYLLQHLLQHLTLTFLFKPSCFNLRWCWWIVRGWSKKEERKIPQMVPIWQHKTKYEI